MSESLAIVGDLEHISALLVVLILSLFFFGGYYFGARHMEKRMRTPRYRHLTIVDTAERA